MASVEPNRRGRGWVVRWRDESGKQRKRTFLRKVDADRLRSAIEHSLNVGSYIDPAAGKVTFRAYAEQWRTAQPHRTNTAGRVAGQLEHHVYPALGGRPLASIRPSEVQGLATGLGTTLAPSTVRVVLAAVRAVFNAATADRLIAHNPATRVNLAPVPRKQIVPLTVDQVDALAMAMPDRYRAVVMLCAGGGLRPGEAFGLQVGDVDWLRRSITLWRQVQVQPKVGPTAQPLKTPASQRRIPVGSVVTDALAAHLAAFPARGEMFVFRTPSGNPLHRAVFSQRVWLPAVKAVGLPGVTCHDLRHFYASALIRAGLSVKVVSARLGHANAAMTLNVYSHLWPDDEDRSRQAIDALFRRGVPQMCPAEEA